MVRKFEENKESNGAMEVVAKINSKKGEKRRRMTNLSSLQN